MYLVKVIKALFLTYPNGAVFAIPLNVAGVGVETSLDNPSFSGTMAKLQRRGGGGGENLSTFHIHGEAVNLQMLLCISFCCLPGLDN